MSILYGTNPFLGDGQNTQTGSYTLSGSDANKTIWMNSGSANTLTLPVGDSLPINSVILVMMEGTGETTIQADSGVTINGIDAGSGVLAQYAGVTLVKRSSNTWIATPLTVA